MQPVTLYTTDACPFCTRAKVLLVKRGIEYEEINLARDPDGRAELVERTGMYTFPQILIGAEPIGGFNELLAADRAGRLAELIAA
ncbi:MAG TPA: glutaredoxin 3 [Solirubrobacteraceae bacterium]|jgi:glutaredoxin 3|nr:glutaredoxin 3 [Solirubrobacteraceae bacterium]